MPTIPKADHYLDGPAFANAWLAAGAAGVKSQADARLDRALSISRYTDRVARTTAGYVFAGISLDLVVVVGVPVRGTVVGPRILRDLVDVQEPADTWLVDDASGVGAPTVRAIQKAAKAAADKGGELRVSLHPVSFAGAGLDVGERALALAADDITGETWVKISSLTPRDWRDAFPKPKAAPMAALAPSFTEDPGLLHARLNRVFGALGGRKVTWTVYELAPGRTAAVCESADDTMFARVARFMDFTGATTTQAGFWDVPKDLADAADPPSDPLPFDPDDADQVDAEAARIIHATFGPGTDD